MINATPEHAEPIETESDAPLPRLSAAEIERMREGIEETQVTP